MYNTIKRSFTTIAMALALALTVTAQEVDNVIDEVIWVVGDEAILRSEVEEQRKQMLYQGQKIDGDPYAVIPEQMAIQKLFLNQAIIDSIEVSDDQIEQRVDAQMSMFVAQIGSKEKVEEYMDKSMNELRTEWRTNFKNQSIMEQMQSKLTEDISVSPSQVRQFYTRLPKDSVPYINTQVEVQIIAMQPRIAQATIDGIKNRLRDYTQRVNSGESQFSTLAILYSEDPGSARNGGELGFKSKNAYVPEFSQAAFQLTEPGKISKVVETEFGFHIIQLIERRGDRANFRHILLTPRVTAKELNDARLVLDTIRGQIDSAKVSFEEAAKYVSSDKATRNSGGVMTSAYSGTARMTMEELPAEVAREVASLKEGEMSRPFIMKDPKTGRDQVAIIRLRKRIDGHKATYVDDYQVIKDLYEEQLREDIIDQFIRDKQKTTYVRIKKGWDHYDFKYPNWVKKE